MVLGCQLLLLLTLIVQPALSLAEEKAETWRTELWSGSIYTSTFKCGFCFSQNGKARGVLQLKTFYGQVDTYHLYGTIKNNKVDLRHSSGHHVQGEILSDQAVKGSITLGTGRTIDFKGQRKQGVRLAKSDCAPLD